MRSKPAGSAAAAQISTSFQRLVPALVLQNERAARKAGLLAVDLQVLHLMVLHEGPITPSTVVALSELPASTVTRVLDRLEANGFLRREIDDADQRKLLIRFERGKVAAVRALFDDVSADFLAFVATFGAEDQATIARFMQGLVSLL